MRDQKDISCRYLKYRLRDKLLQKITKTNFLINFIDIPIRFAYYCGGHRILDWLGRYKAATSGMVGGSANEKKYNLSQ